MIFGDLLDTYEGQIFNTNERQSFMAYITNVSPFQPKHRMSRHLDAWYLGRHTKYGRLSLVVGEGKQRPVKVIHKFYDTYSKLMKSHLW